jgi:peptide deformylase
MPTLLKFVEKKHAILREIIPEIQDFTDPMLHETIKDMCYSILPRQLKKANAPYISAAGMAANQWGVKKRIFIFTPEGSEPGNTLEVMINPSYVPYLRCGEVTPKLVAGFEGCFSVPLTTGIVNRYEAIIATYYHSTGNKVERILEGWQARVFQHETDHLNGKLFDGLHDHYPGPDCLKRIIFNNVKEMEDFWENKVRTSRAGNLTSE